VGYWELAVLLRFSARTGWAIAALRQAKYRDWACVGEGDGV